MEESEKNEIIQANKTLKANLQTQQANSRDKGVHSEDKLPERAQTYQLKCTEEMKGVGGTWRNEWRTHLENRVLKFALGGPSWRDWEWQGSSEQGKEKVNK